MNQEMPLCDLRVGQYATVKRLQGFGSLRRRLQDLGMIPGTKIECVLKNPSGDPIAYFVRGAVIALRNRDSKEILVQYCPK